MCHVVFWRNPLDAGAVARLDRWYKVRSILGKNLKPSGAVKTERREYVLEQLEETSYLGLTG
jgi:hypothetical protein